MNPAEDLASGESNTDEDVITMAKRIHISPGWMFRDEQGEELNPRLFSLLQGIKQTRKLTIATKAAGMSYRHGWNLVEQARVFFGGPVVRLEKGRGAELTPLGEKLLWAEERVAARLKPQMENLASELNIEIQKERGDDEILKAYTVDFISFSYYMSLSVSSKESDDSVGGNLFGGVKNEYLETSGPTTAAITPPAKTKEIALLFKLFETLSAAAYR